MRICHGNKTERALDIGTKVKLGGYNDLIGVVTAVEVHADYSISYQVEWWVDGELKSEWISGKRLLLLAEVVP